MEVMRQGIYWVDFGTDNIKGSEQRNIRPCIVVGNFKECLYSPCSTIIPVTSKINKNNLPTHVCIKKDSSNNLKEDSIALAEQIKCISKDRILEYIGKIDNTTMRNIEMALKISLNLEDKNIKLLMHIHINDDDVKDKINTCLKNIDAVNTVLKNTNYNNTALVEMLQQEKDRYIRACKYLFEKFQLDWQDFINANSYKIAN